MVGDNPASNIQGANSFTSRHGTEWKSILMESGVHVACEEPVHKPTAIVKGVKEAIEWESKDSGLIGVGRITDEEEKIDEGSIPLE